MSQDTESVVRIIANTVLENENYFSELDGVVGDGDFGYSIARGFEKVLHERIPDPSPTPETYTGRWFRDPAQLRAFKAEGALLVHGSKE